MEVVAVVVVAAAGGMEEAEGAVMIMGMGVEEAGGEETVGEYHRLFLWMLSA